MDDRRHDDVAERELWERVARGARRPASPGPSELELAAFVDGLASEAERARVEAHLAGCPLCLEAVVEARRRVGEAIAPSLVVARAEALVARQRRLTWRVAAGWAAAAAASVALGFAGLRAGEAIRHRGRAGALAAREVAFEAPAPYRELLSTQDVFAALASGTREGRDD